MALLMTMGGGDNEPTYQLDRKLWLAADMTTVVEDGDPQARSLLGSAGKSIPLSQARSLGLCGDSSATGGSGSGDPSKSDTGSPVDAPVYLEDLPVAELREWAAERGLAVSGNKQALIDRIAAFDGEE